MRRGETSTLAAAPSSSRRSPPSSESARPGCSGVPSSCRITDSQTLYGSSSQPISTSSVLIPPPRPTGGRLAPVADDLEVEACDLAREVAHARDVRDAVGHVIAPRASSRLNACEHLSTWS